MPDYRGLYLPPDYDYSRFEGSMARTSDAALPLEQVYSLSEYNVRQQAMAQASQGRNLYLNYDENVASLQWDKLEKAQQVAVTKVAPLHVNLPTRGVRYSFSQVLQTELNKPMTIRLLAENTKVPSWTTRFFLAVLCFGVLWAIVATLNRRKTA